MKCLNCKKEISVNSRFCMFCGAKVIICSHCQYGPLPLVAKYCPKCGRKINN
ncbi:MAG: zinc-ribbon domain-containing protein [Bacteroidaceae bacterium]|nr:zinc-ribbon domain-containing protein [Bacteroidaceae bacterium]